MRHLVDIATRPLEYEELHYANDWAVNEGWNPGPHDGEIFNLTDVGSFMTVEIDGSLMGAISAVRMTPNFGFIGFFVLPPEHRNSTHGWILWHASLERMGDRVIGGDGVLERLRNYAHYGFKPHHYTVTHEGVAPSLPTKWRPGIECASGTPLSVLSAYDEVAFGVPRTAFLARWLTLPKSLALVYKRAGRVCGLGVARRCHRGIRIGPLQANDPDAAEALFDALVGLAPGEQIAIDCPEPNTEATALMRKKGLVAGFATARIYRGEPPNAALERVYGQMSFALG